MLWPDAAQKQHVQLALVIAQYDHRTLAVEYFVAVVQDLETHAHGVAADPFEGFGGRPLRVGVVQVEAAEEGGGEGAVSRASDHGAIGGEEARDET